MHWLAYLGVINIDGYTSPVQPFHKQLKHRSRYNSSRSFCSATLLNINVIDVVDVQRMQRRTHAPSLPGLAPVCARMLVYI